MKRLFCILLALVMVLALSACSKGSAATYNDAGYYAIFSVDEDGETLTAADFQSMDWTVFLQLNEDGTGVLDMDDGDVTELTWEDGSITYDGEKTPYVLAGGMLTLDLCDSDGSFVMIFKKGAAPAPETDTADGGLAGRFSQGKNGGEAIDEAAPAAADDDAAEPSAPAAPAPADDADNEPAEGAPIGGGDFTPVSIDGYDYHVEVIGAEMFTDYEDKDAIRFYYDFTNNSDVPISASSALWTSAEEDGYDLNWTFASSEDDVPEYGNDSLTVQPGLTIRCIEEFSFKSSGSDLIYYIGDYDDQEAIEFDPSDLPGRPADDWEIELIPDPQLFLDYPSEGSSDNGSYAISGAELVDEWSFLGDGELIRVYFDYTNYQDDASYIASGNDIWVFQDGIELQSGTPEDDVDSDGIYYDDIPNGETTTVSSCWKLRTDSPVEIVIWDWWNDEVICAGTFYLD